MQPIDLTVIVTAHSEERLLWPTLRSIDVAIRRVVEEGSNAELLIVCDAATERTHAFAEAWRVQSDKPYETRVFAVEFGESGASRNAGAREAHGEHAAFVDGDDLVSPNYFREGLRILRDSTVDTVVHPEYVMSFGARSLLWKSDSMSRDEISYRDLIRHNLWPSCSIAPRALFLAHPYRSLSPELGFGPEDWIWNIDTTSAGIRHECAPETVFFYRVRESGGVNHRHRSSVLPWFDIDALRRALPVRPRPDPILTGPQRMRRRAHGVYARALPFVRRATFWMSWEAKHALYRAARWSYRTVTLARHVNEVSVTDDPPPRVREALHAAAEIDPAVSWTAFNYGRLPTWRARDDGYAEALDMALIDIGDRGRALVLAPWVGVGGADMVALNYAKALQASDRYADRSSIVGTYLPERTVHMIIPGSLRYVHLRNRWLDLPPRARRRFIAQLLILLRPELVVSVNSFHFTEAMQEYGPQVSGLMNTFATLFAFDRIGEGYPTNPITDDSQRLYLDGMSGLITDNTHTAQLIGDILALPEHQILVHPQPVSEVLPELPLGTRAYNNVYFSERNPFRLVWPHRLDEEKRPDALIPLAQELRRRGLPVTIDVWGQYVLHRDGDSLMQRLHEEGVVYRGPYTGGLLALPTYDYHALLLTSQSEGMPLVLVQSLLLGLPVIASDVGGVGDLIAHGCTGMLTEGPLDTAGFADAIEQLMISRDLRRRLIKDGYAAAAHRHSWEAFRATVESMFR